MSGTGVPQRFAGGCGAATPKHRPHIAQGCSSCFVVAVDVAVTAWQTVAALCTDPEDIQPHQLLIDLQDAVPWPAAGASVHAFYVICVKR